jgi:hypothetical protein
MREVQPRRQAARQDAAVNEAFKDCLHYRGSRLRMSAAMRVLFAILVAATVLIAEARAAERQMFIISSNADGYGVDRCLETGAKCGAAIAAAYCKSRQFIQAASYRKVERDEITGSISASDAVCHGANCDEFVAIVCTR